MSRFTKVMWKHRDYIPKGSGKFLITSDYEALLLDEYDVRLIANAPEMYDLLQSLSHRTSGMEPHEVLKIRELLARIDGKEAQS